MIKCFEFIDWIANNFFSRSNVSNYNEWISRANKKCDFIQIIKHKTIDIYLKCKRSGSVSNYLFFSCMFSLSLFYTHKKNQWTIETKKKKWNDKTNAKKWNLGNDNQCHLQKLGQLLFRFTGNALSDFKMKNKKEANPW